MANDRVMLKCSVCAERITLLRYIPGPGILPSKAFDAVEPWLNRHCKDCHVDVGTLDLEGDPRFTTECE